MKYVHIFADDDGTTHFKDAEATMEIKDYAPPSPPLSVSAHRPATGMVSIGFPPGYFGDFHPAPKRQWMISLVVVVAVLFQDAIDENEMPIIFHDDKYSLRVANRMVHNRTLLAVHSLLRLVVNPLWLSSLATPRREVKPAS